MTSTIDNYSPLPVHKYPRYSQAWDRICRHLDGLGIGSTVAALYERGVLEWLQTNPNARLSGILSHFGGNSGFLQLAMRLLACQGWFSISPFSDYDDSTFTLTPKGRLALTYAQLYKQAFTRFVELNQLLPELDRHDEAIAALALEYRKHNSAVSDLTPDLQWQIAGHLDGHFVGPIMSWLESNRIFSHFDQTSKILDLREQQLPYLRAAFEILEIQGWLRFDSVSAQLTPEGTYAAACAKQYWYPIAYAQTLIRIPKLLFGELPITPETDGEETHVDRALDIQFSGKVFSATCRSALEKIVIPLFTGQPPKDRIKAIVDTGCGDGSLLGTLHRTIATHAPDFAEPLLMIGVEPSSTARRVASTKLRGEQVPHLMLEGDITCPQEIARQLSAQGFHAENTLHVSKSVIHNRRYLSPSQTSDLDLRSSNVFTLRDGSRIPAGHLEQNLVEHFQAWRPLTERHGMVVIEAHTAPVNTITRLLGRSIATLVDSLHGYSSQYLVEPSVFMGAARKANYQSRHHVDLGQKTTGHVCLTIDHFV
jgi:hypothetical protein